MLIPNSYLKEFLSEKPIVISQLLLKYYTKLQMDEIELVTILQLIRFRECLGDSFPTVEKLEKVMSLGSDRIKATLARLIEKGLVKVEHSSNANNYGKSSYILDPLWDRLLTIWEQDKAKRTTQNETTSLKLRNVYKVFEKEFGRFLSPIESSKIVQWCENDGFSSELIIEALKRAVLQGALSFKYIDSILMTWRAQNLQSIDEVEEYERKFNNKKNNKKQIYSKYNTKGTHDKFSEIYVT